MEEKSAIQVLAANDNHHDFYVYAWLRPNGEPFYIGKGRGRRAWQIKYSNPFFMKVVERIRVAGAEPAVIKWQDGLREEDALRLERAYIKLFGRRDNRTGVLVNLTDGGDGLSGAIFSESHRNKIAKGRTGKRHTTETRLALSMAKSGKPISASHRAAISAAQTGRTHSEETKKKISDRNKNKVIPNEVRAKIVGTMTGRKLAEAHIENMRAATARRYTIPEERERTAQATRRTPPNSRNSSAFKGVSQPKDRGNWRATIFHNGSRRHLGSFSTPEEAARAYDSAARAAWGDECYMNFPVAGNDNQDVVSWTQEA